MTTSHRRTHWLRAAAVLAAVVLLPWSAAGAATQDELEATRSRIQDTIAELEAVDEQAEQTEEQVAAAEARVQELEAALNDLLTQMEAQQRAVDAARSEADAAAAERDRIERLVGERARRAFMGASPDPIMMLGTDGMEDVTGALNSMAMLDALSARANASIETLDVARVQADATAERLDREVAALEEVRATREELLAEAEEVLDQRAEALADLEAQSDRLMAQREDLEAEEADLEQLIRQRKTAAAADAAPAPAPPPASGCYAWPANGAVTSEYGARWGRTHRGIDIDGDTGDALVAAQSGTVSFAGYYGGYGNLTLIRHSDGVTTAYAHQSSIGVSEGQTVARGEFIGRMGATGNVTGSHLHLETRTSSGAVNPRNYLC
jgi:murein DD-endopeptidase MepM/ murein hydrolase activator NlpD